MRIQRSNKVILRNPQQLGSIQDYERLLVALIFFSALQGSHSLDQRFLSNLINSDLGRP